MKRPKKFAQTDAGNAEFFAAEFRNRILFDHKQKRWLIWSEKATRWQEDRTGQIRELMKRATEVRALRAIDLPVRTKQEQDRRKDEMAWAVASQSLFRIDAALELAKSISGIADPGANWDADPWLLGVSNGVVDLKTGEFRPGTQQDRITKFTSVKFDAKATCSRLERFILEVSGGDTEIAAYLQRAIGYTLTGSTKEQCLFACYGSGSNGKTTLFEVLNYLLGDYATDLPFAALDTKHHAIGEGVNLPGSRFVKSVETRDGRQLDEARIKSWTGGDTITIRPLHRNGFSFIPTHKHWLSFNDKPVIRDDSPAMWRRMRLIPFTQTFDGKDKDGGLLEKLKAEAPGILNWAISGAIAWQRDGLGMPKAIAEATAQYQVESDPLGPFFEDCCVIGSTYNAYKGQLREQYLQWCKDNYERPLSRNAFAAKLERKGIIAGRSKTQRYWIGIGLVTNKLLGTSPLGTNPPKVMSPEAESGDVKSSGIN